MILRPPSAPSFIRDFLLASLALSTVSISPRALAQGLVARPIRPLVEDADPEPAPSAKVAPRQDSSALSTKVVSSISEETITPEESALRLVIRKALPADRHYIDLAATVIARLYAERGFRPVWNASAADAGAVTFQRSLATELNHHALPELKALDPEALLPLLSATSVESRDLAKTIAFLDSALLIRIGAVPFTKIWPDWDLGNDPGSNDRTVDSILADLLTATSLRPFEMGRAISTMAPKNWIYRELLKAYPTAKEAILKYSGLPQIPSPEQIGPGRPGQPYAGAPAIAAHLVDRGYLKISSDMAATYAAMTPDLTSALIAFQADLGLEPDGVFGLASWRCLNMDAADQFRSIVLNLHRARLIPSKLGDRYVIANLPGAELYLFDANDFLAGSMRIVHGKASVASQHTKIFRNRMKEVVFGPYWNVPPSIAKKELLPLIENDWGYLSRNNYELVDSFGSKAVTRISPATLSDVASGKLLIRQKPGGSNALGYVKFLFPNSFNIYMHDTPSRSYFAMSNRDLSHGCIRVQKPDELAAWVFSPEGWSLDQVKGRMKSDLNKGVAVKGGINVYITYFTIFPRPVSSGNFILTPCRDVYSLDPVDSRTLSSVLPWQEKTTASLSSPATTLSGGQ